MLSKRRFGKTLIMLLTELDTKMPITSSSKGSTLSCINRYVPIVPKARTRKETFEILLLNGFYVPRKNKSNYLILELAHDPWR